jgi:rhamnogalacturonyl hydrolase YesR
LIALEYVNIKYYRMIKNIWIIIFLGISNIVFGQNESLSNSISSKSVIENMERVANWQMYHFRDKFSGRDKPHHVRDWTNGALYVGMTKYAALAKDDRYWKWMKQIGEEQSWKLHWRKYMADDHTVGQMYIELFRKYGDSTMIKGTKDRFDYIMENPSKQPITLDKYKHLERWTWCDALFMAPPICAKLSNITGDKKYSDWMLKEYEASKQHLFDTEENLFFRDDSFIDKRDHGNKVFWARGNGWVFGGLTLLMDEYEADSKEYKYFKDIYIKMAKKLIQIQTPEGHWAMSLLNQEFYKTPETSGTSFFTFGLAWGINHGILDKDIYQPHVERAWNCLIGHINSEGMLGYVQPIGAGPDKSFKDQTEVYGTGAFLAAGSEVYTLFGGQPIFQLEEPDYEKSPITGMTRKHWKDAAMYMLEGAFSYVNSIDDPLKFPKIGKVGYPRGNWENPVEKLEGLCRTLFVAAPLLKENPDLVVNGIYLGNYYRQNILNLLDEKHPSFIKDKQGDWPGQTLVEFGALSMSMFTIPEVLWDPLTKEQQDVLARKMISYGDGRTVPSNWKFFNIFVLSFFKAHGYQVNEDLLVKYLNKSLDHYKGDGWYNDNPAYDYYSMWAFQMYGPVWSELFGEKYYPEIAKKFKENFLPMEENYPYMFSKNGEMIMWGRSITYRFASISPFPLLSFYEEDLPKANWGALRRTSSGVLLQFLQHPEFMKDNIPTLGFYGVFDPSTQPYSCRGSVYWMAKSFLSLLSPEKSKFWTEKENNGVWEKELKNVDVSNRFYEGSKILVTNYPEIGASEIRAWCNVKTKGIKEPFRSSENYNKLSYNSAFPWQADNKAKGVASMNYVFKTNDEIHKNESGHLYEFEKYEDGIYYRKLKSEFLENTTMSLADIPLKNGILRVDKITSSTTAELKLGHYSLPHINGYIKKESRKINDIEVQIIDNGEYQLALVPIKGWDAITTITSKGLHPTDKESTVINVSDSYNPATKDNVYVTALLWKKSGEKFSNDELQVVKKVKIKKNKGQISVRVEGHKKKLFY